MTAGLSLTRIAGYLAGVLMLCTASAASGALLFDNGSVDPSRTPWNDTDPVYTAYDGFVLTSNATISGIQHSIFIQGSAGYQQTYISIYDGISTTANPVVADFSAVGVLTSNGLTTGNSYVPNGFDVAINGLSINLGPGTYYLGIRTDMSGTLLASIGSGPGSPQTIGSGLFLASGTSPAAGGATRTGDHMAFQLFASTIPEPGTLAIFGFGLAGLALLRRRRWATRR